MEGYCKATTKAGAPCAATHYRDGWCIWHHPDRESHRKAGSVAGGRGKASTVRAKRRVFGAGLDLAEVDRAMCKALVDVLAGELEPGIATAAASIARTITAVRQVADLETRITALEARQEGRSA